MGSGSAGTLLRLLAVVLIPATVALGGAPPTMAHTVLVSSEPADGTTVSTGPQRVGATFNEELQPTFAAMTVVGPDGNLWSSGEPEVRGTSVAVAVKPLGPSGRYTVNYRVTSADGHVVTGSWSFTVTVASTGTPGPPASAGESSQHRIPLWPFVVGFGILAAGGAGWAVRRRS